MGLLFDPFESVALYLASTRFLSGVIRSMIDSRVHLCSVRFRRDGTHDATPPAPAVNTMNYVVADGRSNWMEGFILICMSLCFVLARSGFRSMTDVRC